MRAREIWKFSWMGLLLLCLSVNALGARWYKGNLHTHTLWSDGDDYPEMVAEWYKTNGYHFLALSDHNIVLQGEKWIELKTNKAAQLAFQKYKARHGAAVQVRDENGKTLVRLKNLEELRALFEERRKFLMVPSEEISASFEKLPIHINASNIRELIKPRGGKSVYEVMQNNIDAVLEQREKTGQPMIPHLNHPNFHYAVTAEDLMRVKGERFFEVYNGHPSVFNQGDAQHPSTERMWDIVLAWRLAILKMEPLFGIAVDDSHHYHEMHPRNANSGRGWIMVRARRLSPEAIIEAMEAGDFYASSGVRLKALTRRGQTLSVSIDPEPGVTYTTHFIGTRHGFYKGQTATGGADVDPDSIGQELGRVEGVRARYNLQPGDLYVRAVVVSSKPKANGTVPNEVEKAWTQPLIAPGYLHLPVPPSRKSFWPFAFGK